MLSIEPDASSSDFVRTVVRGLESRRFFAPTVGEAHAVVCNSAAWTSFVGSAQWLLSPDERARSARLRFDRDRSTYILAHALWRAILGFCLDVHAAEVRLTSTAAGQPRLSGTAFSTSLSHSGGWVAVAVCGGEVVGIDIERSPPHVALNALMPTICAPAEIAELELLSPTDRELALLALWTRKEALLKAFGTGLGVDPSLLSAKTNTLVAPLPSPTVSNPMPCRVANLELSEDLVGALAVPGSVATTRLWILEG